MSAPSVAPRPRQVRRKVTLPSCPAPTGLSPAERTALALTTFIETGVPLACRVSHVDGISMGMLQWNLKAATLQALFRAFEARGGRLDRYLGAEAANLRALIALRPPEAVQRAKAGRLAERWRRPLEALCIDPLFCQLQVDNVRYRLKAAARAAQRLGLRTVRGLAMMFDIHVGDGFGPGESKIALFAKRIAARQVNQGGPLSERERLEEIALTAAVTRVQPTLRAPRRARRLLIARGRGWYRGSERNLDARFPGLDRPWA